MNATARRHRRSRAVRAAPVSRAESGHCSVCKLRIAKQLNVLRSHLRKLGDFAEIVGIEVLGVFSLAGGIFVRTRKTRAVESRGTPLEGTLPSEQTHRDVVETENFDRTADRFGCGIDLNLRLASGGRNGLLLGKCIHTLRGKRNNPHHRSRIVTLMTTRKPTGVEACERVMIGTGTNSAQRNENETKPNHEFNRSRQFWIRVVCPLIGFIV